MKNSAKDFSRQHQTCWGIDRYVSDEYTATQKIKILDFDWLEGFGEYQDFSSQNLPHLPFAFIWQRRAIVC